MLKWLISLKNLGYLGAFLISLIGAGSIVIPIPYQLIILLLSPFFNPLMLALVSGFGSTLGELSSYGIGIAGRKILGKKYRKRLNTVRKLFEKFGLTLIFLFSLTPLPDDILFIPLGLMRYSVIKALVASFVGKFLMFLLIIYTGRIVEEVIEINWYFGGITMLVIVIIILLMLKVSWERLLKG